MIGRRRSGAARTAGDRQHDGGGPTRGTPAAPAGGPPRRGGWARVRRFWRERRWLVLGGLALLALGLGWVGYERAGERSLDAVYYAIQLFALNAHDLGPGVALPPELAVARFLAPAVAAAATIQAVYSLLREQLQLFGVRTLFRGHTVVVGLGTVGSRLAHALRAAGERVVVVERDPAHPEIAGCRERRIPVVRGDATDAAILRQTGLDRARRLLVASGDDGTNLDVAVSAAGVTGDRARDLDVHVHLEDLALWRRLQAQVLSTADHFPFRVQFFNVLDAAARLLLARHPPFDAAAGGNGRPPHLLFVGFDWAAELTALHAIGRWRAAAGDGAPLRLTVTGPGTRAPVEALAARYPELEELCELAVDEVDIASPRFQRGDLVHRRQRLAPVTCVYVFLGTETDALTAALVLRAQPETRDVPVVVTVQDESAGVASLVEEGHGRLDGVHAFGMLTRALAPDLLLLGTTEVLARARHDHYVHGEAARGETRGTNPSMVAWDELPEILRESNRMFADGIGRKLAVARFAVVPSPLARVDGAPCPFDEEEVEELARMEHERWRADLERRGFRRTTGEKDPHRKLHPLLVPWEELGPVEQERSRASIRAIPEMLARAGFELSRVE